MAIQYVGPGGSFPTPAGGSDRATAGQAAPRGPVSPGVADGTIAYDTNGKPVYVLADQHWVPYDPRRAPLLESDASTFPISLLRDEYHARPDGTWQHITTGDKLAAAFAPIVDASHNAGHEQLGDKYGANRPNMHKDGTSASATTQASKELNLNETDKKDLKEWAAMIHRSPWLLPKNPADKAAWLELAKSVEDAVRTGDWSVPDRIAGEKPKLGEQITQAMRSWDAYSHNAKVAAAKAHSAASADSVADARKDYTEKTRELERCDEDLKEKKNDLAGLETGRIKTHPLNKEREIDDTKKGIERLEHKKETARVAAALAEQRLKEVEKKAAVS